MVKQVRRERRKSLHPHIITQMPREVIHSFVQWVSCSYPLRKVLEFMVNRKYRQRNGLYFYYPLSKELKILEERKFRQRN